jgi:DNA polymerase-1
MHPAYIAYAAADPLLTYHVWRKEQFAVREFHDLYQFDHRIQLVCDELQRRAIRLDVPYTEMLSEAFTRKANRYIRKANEYGCRNIHSGQQVADTLLALGARLRERTPTGKYKTDDGILRALMTNELFPPGVKNFIRCVLIAKQLLKRRENYTEAMLREMDSDGRVHPSINSLGARTTRMSVSKPALQQLPTKDRDDEEE